MSTGTLSPSSRTTENLSLQTPTPTPSNGKATRDSTPPALPKPAITPTPRECSHPQVVIELSTVLVIQNYNIYYRSTPIDSFQPMYRSVADGSLISPPFEEDLLNANFNLFILGSLSAIFIRNIFTSAAYVRRGKVKKKTLFYLLLASQLLAPVSLAPVILSHFLEASNCTVVVMLSSLGSMVSLGILITGILGIKAYKCLENPRILPVILFVLQGSSSAVVIADLVQPRAIRRLTGSCVQIVNLKYTRFFVGLQVIQALFVCLCFVWASYKSRSNPAARGRISLRLSMDDVELELPACCEEAGRQNLQGRGWWDYVPGSNDASTRIHEQGNPGYAKPSWVKRFLHFSTQQRRCKCHRPTAPQSTSHEPKSQTRNLPDVAGNAENNANPFDDAHAVYGRRSPAFSTNSGLSRLFPRMELFRQVLNDELLYTTFITFACAVVAILVAISVNFETCLSITGWIAINWAFISLLIVHSLGRVVHRHERESWIQRSATRTALTQGPTRNSGRLSRRAQTGQLTSSFVASSRTRSIRERYRGDPNDPFSDTRPLDQERFSWQFGTVEGSSSNNHAPLLLSVRNVTHDSQSTQEFEFEPALERNTSWQPNVFSSNARISAASSAPSVYSDMDQGLNAHDGR